MATDPVAAPPRYACGCELNYHGGDRAALVCPTHWKAVAAQPVGAETPQPDLPEVIVAQIVLFRDSPAAWHREWQRQHDFKVALIERAEKAEAELKRLQGPSAAVEPRAAPPVGAEPRELTADELWFIASVFTDHAEERAKDEDQPDGQHDAERLRAISGKCARLSMRLRAAGPSAASLDELADNEDEGTRTMNRHELIDELHRQTDCAMKSQAALQRERDAHPIGPSAASREEELIEAVARWHAAYQAETVVYDSDSDDWAARMTVAHATREDATEHLIAVFTRLRGATR